MKKRRLPMEPALFLCGCAALISCQPAFQRAEYQHVIFIFGTTRSLLRADDVIERGHQKPNTERLELFGVVRKISVTSCARGTESDAEPSGICDEIPHRCAS